MKGIGMELVTCSKCNKISNIINCCSNCGHNFTAEEVAELIKEEKLGVNIYW